MTEPGDGTMVVDQRAAEERAAMDLFRLDGRVALVTGGAGRYGRPISRALADAGAHAVIAARDIDRCRAFAEELRASGLQASGTTPDLAQEESIRRLSRWLGNEFGRLDVLFNNAVSRRLATFEEQTAEDWEQTLRVDAVGFFLAYQIFGGMMAQQGSGSIVNVASIYGLVGPDFSIYGGTELGNPPNYACAKGGMIALTRSTRRPTSAAAASG